MPDLVNLDKLPGPVRLAVEHCLAEMVALHGDNLLSALVYGSGTGRDYLPGVSDINLLFVFREITLDTLKRSLKTIARGRRRKMAAPLFLTREYMEQSTDVFPIEFLEFADNRVLVYGTDPFEQLVVERENLRLECEGQLKSQLVRLRQVYLETGLRARDLDRLLKASLSALIPVFRALYRLKGQPVPGGKESVLNRLNPVYEVDPSVFLEIWHDRKNNNRIGARHAEEALGRYITEIFNLAGQVACLDPGAPGRRENPGPEA